MSGFRTALSEFEKHVRDAGEGSQYPGIDAILAGRRDGGSHRMRWAIAAAMILLLGAITVYESQRKRCLPVEARFTTSKSGCSPVFVPVKVKKTCEEGLTQC